VDGLKSRIKMKSTAYIFFIIGVFAFTGFASKTQDEAEFVCMKNQKSTNTCFYNFKIGGVPYHFRDMGCKRKKDDIIKDVNEGELALSKDWKIPCPEEKKEDTKNPKTNF
jgi:hypothetical protein